MNYAPNKRRMEAGRLVKKIFLLHLVLFAAIAVQGQSSAPNLPRPVTLYYNSAMELTTREKAQFRREASLDFENIIFVGICKDYYIDNKLASEAFYENGVNKGLNTDYNAAGKLQSTIEYGAAGGFVIWDLVNERGEVLVTRGTGKFNISCYMVEAAPGGGATLKQGSVIGEFTAGKRTGRWLYLNANGEMTDEEFYENGEFATRTSYGSTTGTGAGPTSTTEHLKKNIIISLEDILAETFQFEKGTFVNLQDVFEKNAPPLPADYNRAITFPGGMKKLLLIIALGLTTEVDENQIVRLTVDEKGKFTKIKSNFLLGSGFSDELTAIVKPHAAQLLPALQNGKPVSMSMRIPVANSREWIAYLQSVPDDDVNAYLDELNQP